MPKEAFVTLCCNKEHDEARHDEGAIADAVDLGDARANGGAEHHEIKRGRNDRRDDALRHGAPGSRHLESVDRLYSSKIHRGLFTRLTKISSSELCLVCKSLNRIPASLRPCSK